MEYKWDSEGVISLISLAFAFFLVQGGDNKLIVGGVFFIYLSIIQFLECKIPKIRGISFYGGIMSLSLGIFSLGIVYLLPESPNLFAMSFGISLFLVFIFLFIFGPKGFFKNFLFVIFLIPFIWAIYSLFAIFFSTGLDSLRIPEFILGILAILTIGLIYWAILSFFFKIFPKNKLVIFLRTKRGIISVLILLVLALCAGFLFGKISFFSLEKTILKIPFIPQILTISGFISLVNSLFR